MIARRLSPLGGVIGRYGLVSASSALVSVAHFSVQLVAIARLGVRDIGMLAFAITLIQFGFGLSNALVCAPYSIAAARTDDDRDQIMGTLRSINLLLAIAYGLVCLGVVWAGSSRTAAIGFGIAAGLLLVRWFARNDAYTRQMPIAAAWSDLIYAMILMAWVAVGLVTSLTLAGVSAGFVVAALLALLPFRWLRRLPMLTGATTIGAYRRIWRGQASWALVGVASTEATTNGHTYLVTALLGPAAFAPLGVGALFLRPLNVCITALTQTERPRMARDLAAGDAAAAIRSGRHFRWVLIALWAGTSALAAATLIFAPAIVIPAKLDANAVRIAVALTVLVALIQCLMTPDSVLLQAADRFRLLAMTSVAACGITIIAVAALLQVLPAEWSLVGVALGQAAMLLGIRQVARGWRAQGVPGEPARTTNHA